MFDIKIKTWMQGSTHILGEDDISNYEEIIGWMEAGTPCHAEVIYEENTFYAQIQLTEDETHVMVAFDDTDVNLPPGICIHAFCDCDCEIDEPLDCYPNEITDIDENSRLAVVDDDGCFVGNVKMSTLLDWIRDHLGLDIPETICDLMPDNQIPYGQLVASDRVLVVDQETSCEVKSVAQSEVFCENN